MTRSRRAMPLVLASILLVPVMAIAGDSPALPSVEEDYVLHCSACHGPDGAGAREVVPGLFETGAIALRPGGRDYLMRVPGAAQSPLDDARLARLLGWVVTRFGGIELDAPFDAVEVGLARAAPLRDPMAARRNVLASSSTDLRDAAGERAGSP